MVDSMDAVARRQHGLVTRRQALDAGQTPSAIRHLEHSGRWHRVAHGVYRLDGAPKTDRQRLLAAVLACRQPAFACRTTAAALYGLPGFTVRPFHVVTHIGTTTTIPIATAHRTNRIDVRAQALVDCIPTTTLPRTLFDLCGCVPFARAERAVETALARRLVRPEALGAVFASIARRGRLGSAGLRAYLDARGMPNAPALESELERRFHRLVVDHALPSPEFQVNLGAPDGWIGRVDAYFRRARVVVELDGAEHHSSLLDRRADAERDAALRDAGFSVVRLTWNDVVGHPTDAVARLRFALNQTRKANFVEQVSP